MKPENACRSIKEIITGDPDSSDSPYSTDSDSEMPKVVVKKARGTFFSKRNAQRIAAAREMEMLEGIEMERIRAELEQRGAVEMAKRNKAEEKRRAIKRKLAALALQGMVAKAEKAANDETVYAQQRQHQREKDDAEEERVCASRKMQRWIEMRPWILDQKKKMKNQIRERSAKRAQDAATV